MQECACVRVACVELLDDSQWRDASAAFMY
jgi:hypothetical protein